MVFSYYARLSRRRQAIYRRSDAVESVPLPAPERLQPLVAGLEQALRTEKRQTVGIACRELVAAIVHDLEIRPVRIAVLAVRPHNPWAELHGLYQPPQGKQPARIRVWMRTAKHGRVVAFRTFLRTLLHELCHHLDYELLRLPESFHTEGFFKREASLFHQLVG